MYQCTKCLEHKPTGSFTGWPRNKWCRACASQYQKELRAKGYKPTGRNVARRSTDPAELAWEDRLNRALLDGKRNARVRGLAFDLRREDLPSNRTCAITGLPMTSAKLSPWLVSIDRKDSSRGYSPDNIQLVCWSVNRAKGDLSKEDFAVLCKALGGLAQD